MEIIKKLSLETETYSPEPSKYYGGVNNILTLDGGFPPIYEILEKSEDDKKKREYMADNSIMSVHNILTDRKKIPFLPMRTRTGIDETVLDFKQVNFKRNVKKSSKKRSKKTSKKGSKKY